MKWTTNDDLSSTMLGLCIDSFLDMHGRSTESKVILARLMHAHIRAYLVHPKFGLAGDFAGPTLPYSGKGCLIGTRKVTRKVTRKMTKYALLSCRNRTVLYILNNRQKWMHRISCSIQSLTD